MRASRVFLAILALASPVAGYATDFTYNGKIKPISFLLFGPNFELEKKVGDHFSIAPVFYYVRLTPQDTDTKINYEQIAYDFGLNAYYYFNQAMTSGPFISPFLHYYVEVKDTYEEAMQAQGKGTKNGKLWRFPVAGATLGYQWYLRSGLTTGIEAGAFVGTPMVGAGVLAAYSVGWAF